MSRQLVYCPAPSPRAPRGDEPRHSPALRDDGGRRRQPAASWPRAYALHRVTRDLFEIARGPMNLRYVGSDFDPALWHVWVECRASWVHGVRGFGVQCNGDVGCYNDPAVADSFSPLQPSNLEASAA